MTPPPRCREDSADLAPAIPILCLIPAAYLLGAVPFGFLVAKGRGVDIREVGSKNIGATNVGRVLGKKFFWVVLALDAAKGFVPMFVGAHLVAGMDESPVKYGLWLAAGLAALLGHLFPIYLGFKGGKGVATALGLLLGVYPYFTLAAGPTILTFVIVFGLFRYISLASIIGVASFSVWLVAIGWWMHWDILGPKWPLLAFGMLVSVMIIYRHRGNIARLRAGTEPKFTGKKPGSAEPSRAAE